MKDWGEHFTIDLKPAGIRKGVIMSIIKEFKAAVTAASKLTTTEKERKERKEKREQSIEAAIYNERYT